MRTLTVATRKSPLALTQTRAWVRELRERYPTLEVLELEVRTTGDRILDRELREIGGKGLFVKEIEQALLDGSADLAVHSMKDVPPSLGSGLALGSVPKRADPRDVLVSPSGAKLRELAPRSRVGTTSLRRQVELARLRPDLVFVSVRGNVETRLRKCDTGEVDAVVLARAGLERLGLLSKVTETFEPSDCVPAAGQGALAVEVRASDADLFALLEPLSDRETLLSTSAERGVMTAVHGSCQVPVGAYACRDKGELWLQSMLANADGSNQRRAEARCPFPQTTEEAFAFGAELGERLRGLPPASGIVY